ncbi:ABC transporter ATP-binding protein [Chelativorans sp. YIM 93263]|uniref:ABC transporter ATP-binding protein n=1 Tax=Chelativorans sp. YIM 93263 TaxID=2906648 RepID=UPI002378A2C2|nr:ABC transporter ATP-binding protein [Chelativorans sp. YIM 93263]
MSSVTLERLAKKYGQVEVVKGVSTEIGEGELIVLLGPSGCGKTTILRMIAGFIEPSSGTVLIGGKAVNKVPPRARDIGMVFQDYALFPNMSVQDNVAFGLVERGVPRNVALGRTQEMLKLIQMEQFGERYPTALSGGQQQRVALARALAYEPRVLLMDEPLGALDQKLREDMQRDFSLIQRKVAITTVFVTHDQQEAMALADRIIVMNAGRIEQIGRPQELYDSPSTLFIADFIGRSNKLKGHVEHITGEAAQIRLEGGETIGAKVVGTAREGQNVVCVVRPERLSIGGVLEANKISARLAKRSFLGDAVDYIFERQSGEQIILRSSRSAMPESIGQDTLEIGFEPRDTLCFPGSASTVQG